MRFPRGVIWWCGASAVFSAILFIVGLMVASNVHQADDEAWRIQWGQVQACQVTEPMDIEEDSHLIDREAHVICPGWNGRVKLYQVTVNHGSTKVWHSTTGYYVEGDITHGHAAVIDDDSPPRSHRYIWYRV